MVSNLDEYDIDRNKHTDKKDSSKDKCACTIDILPTTEMSANAHEMISFEDSYDDYANDSVIVIVTEHSSRDKVNANKSLSMFKY